MMEHEQENDEKENQDFFKIQKLVVVTSTRMIVFIFRLLNILKNIDQSWWRCRGS